MNSQRGQVILILVLVMTVALAIGLSVIQRSISDISTASKAEQSSRAFSAAEAGIEFKLGGGASGSLNFATDNGSSAQVVGGDLLPIVPATGSQLALEYPPLAREELAQVWLADPTSPNFPVCPVTDPTKICYSASTLGIYWGNKDTSENPAIEISIIYQDSSTPPAYLSKKYFLNGSAATRTNNFDSSTTCSGSDLVIDTILSTNKTFFCMKNIDVSSTALPGLSRLILLRARLLYNDTSQSFAVKATSGSLPPQAKIYTATGEAGGTQRKVQVFRIDKVVPPYFDYAIFSAGDINK